MHDEQNTKSRLVELNRTDRLVSNKTDSELLNDLKVYLARLRDDPRSIPDRLRVAAIQLHLGRIPEAMIHYEGVLREYVQTDQIMNAIELCQQILKRYPELPRIQRFLAASYARAPRGSMDAPSAVTPVPLEEEQTRAFIVEDSHDIVMEELEEEGTIKRDMVVDRVFPELNTNRCLRQPTPVRGGIHLEAEHRPTAPAVAMEDEKTAVIAEQGEVLIESRRKDRDDPHLLTYMKHLKSEVGDGEPVILLTKRKKKR
jgi:hypothetical protein